MAVGRLTGVLALGAVVGVAVSQSGAAVLAVAGAALMGWVAVSQPLVLAAVMYLGILVDRLGATGVDIADFPVTASKLSVAAALGLWAVRAIWTGERAARAHPVLFGIGALVLTSALSIGFAGTMEDGRFTLLGLAMMAVMVGLLFTILAEHPLAGLYRFMAAALVLALAVSILSGGASGGASGEAARVTGSMGDPNEWATLVLLLTPTLLGGLADDDHPVALPLRLGLVVLAPASVLLAASRAGMLLLALLAPALLVLLWRRRLEVVAALGLAVLGVPLLVDLDMASRRLGLLFGRLTGAPLVDDGSLSERGELLRQGVDLFANNWLVGVGTGNFARATGFVGQNGRLRPAHNTYLEIAAEQGVVGLLAAALLGALVVWSLRRAWMAATDDAWRRRVLGASLGLGATALMAATLGLLTFSMAWLVLGFTLAVCHQARTPHARL